MREFEELQQQALVEQMTSTQPAEAQEAAAVSAPTAAQAQQLSSLPSAPTTKIAETDEVRRRTLLTTAAAVRPVTHTPGPSPAQERELRELQESMAM